MQKNTGKKGNDFESAFEKYAQMLPKDYKDQFKKVEYAGPKSKQAKINQAVRSGQTVTVVNKGGSNSTGGVANIGKLLNDDKIIEIKENPKEFAHQVQQARNEHKLSQEQLATKINEKVSVINDIENATGKYNPQIFEKIEKALNVKFDRSWKKK